MKITCGATIYLMAVNSSAAPDIVMRPTTMEKVTASQHWLLWTSHSMGTGISNSKLGRTCRRQLNLKLNHFVIFLVHELSMHRSPCPQLDSLFKTLGLFGQETHFRSVIIYKLLLLHICKGS